MDAANLRSVIRRLGRAVSAGGLTDAELLRRWLAHRDEGAFEALLWRHAAAVLGVCRRVLGDVHEAEDATQAAFLTLARKGGTIGRRQAVAAWLYTVAYRTALRASARRPRDHTLSLDALSALPSRPAEDPAWRDLRPVLDEEVSRLPEKYRAAFVLCHVAGRTNEEAARELGCPVGTVLSRLARARERLRARLTRRGVTLSTAALTAALAGETAAAHGIMVRGAVRAAALAAAGESLAGAVPAEVVALTEGVVRAMLVTKVKVVAAVVVGLVLLGGVVSYRTAAGEPGGAALGEPAVRAADEVKAPAPPPKVKDEVAELRDRVKALEELLGETRRLELTALSRKMRGIQERLASAASGPTTQEMQKEVLDRLDRVIQNVEGQQKAAPDDKLRNLAAELKLVRAQQARINTRTEGFGKLYPGEVVPPPTAGKDPSEMERLGAARLDLKSLGERQGKIAQITDELAGKQGK
jgi:RNA polymerase sigma factor (sigma-70 family)